MEELWLIIAVTVGLLTVITIGLSIRRKRTFRKDGFLTITASLLVLGIIFGSTDQLLGYLLIGLSVTVSIIAAIKGLKQK